MRRTGLLSAIFLCTCVFCAQAQTASIDIARIEAIADPKTGVKAPAAKVKTAKPAAKKAEPVLDPATYEDEAQNKQKAKYFARHISLINNDEFGFKLIANPAPAAPVLAQFTIAKGKPAEKKTFKSKDAAYFRKQISLFNGDVFGLNLEPYVVAKKAVADNKKEETTTLPEAASTVDATNTANTSTITAIAETVATTPAEVKFTAKDAAFFKKRISLMNGDNFRFALVPYKGGVKKEVVEAETAITKPKIKAKDAAYFRKHISLFDGEVFQLSLAANGAEHSVDLLAKNIVKKVVYIPENKYATGIFTYIPQDDQPKSPIPSVTDQELQDFLYGKLTATMTEMGSYFSAISADTIHAKIPQKMPSAVTTLKQQVGLIYNDTLRATLYQKIADRWLGYDSITIRTTKRYYQDEAIDITMKALHTYSKMGNPDGMCLSYTNLARVYKDQRVFPQAKWFILQANTVAREEKNTKSIISTLIDLANIKRAVNDHEMAVDDLNEALRLSTQNNLLRQEAAVQANLAIVYGELNELTKSANATKRHDAIEASIRKAAEAKKVAAEKKAADKAKKLLSSTEKATAPGDSTQKATSL